VPVMATTLDLRDPEFLEDPYPALGRAREATPVVRVEKPRLGRELWLLTRHADVLAAQRDRRLGRVRERAVSPEELGLDRLELDWRPYYELERWSLLMLEPPDHTRIRRLVAKEFTPRRLAALRDRITAYAVRFLERAVEQGGFDLLAAYAQPYSVHVIAELLGAPTGDWRHLLDWSHHIVKMYELEASDAEVRAAVGAAAEFTEWTRRLIARRRRDPGTDLVSALCTVETEEGRLHDDEIVSTVVLLLNAGHEATVNTMGNGVTALLQHRDQWERLVVGEVPCRVGVEELIRWDPPLQLFERWVLEDGVGYGGRRFAAGEKIGMLLGSANRDPRRFEDPDRFDVGRGDASHVTFGGGIHSCLGAPLARLELEVALEVLVRRCPRLEAAGEPERHGTFVIHGYRSVPVRSG